MACVDHDGTRVGWDVTAAAWWGAAQHHAGVAGKLPLDSPFWDRLSACHSKKSAIARNIP